MNEAATLDPCDRTLWTALLAASSRVEGVLDVRLAEVGLSLPKLSVLRTLVEATEPMPLSRLAGKLSCVKSNVTQLVDRLEADGLVARENDPTDRRSILAVVTDAGRVRFEAGRSALSAGEEQLFAELSLEERRRLHEILCALGR